MIAKGNQRGGGQQLATHLLNAYDNERVELADLRGAVANDLQGALAEWSATAKATRCRKFLYSLSVNPDPRQGPLTRQQYVEFLDRAEKELGLSGQPRAVVFHTKEGREHCHAVWSRIDPETIRARQLSHDRMKLRTVVRGFAKDHGLELPRGIQERPTDRFNRHAREINHAEKQQEERTGLTKAERVKEITEAWKQSDTGKAFVTAIDQRGYTLARGDRGAYVVLDAFGEVHKLARQIDGAKTKDLKNRLQDFPLESLPDVATVQEAIRKRQEERDRPSPSQSLEQRSARLAWTQAQRRDELESKRQDLEKQHQKERDLLQSLHEQQEAPTEQLREERREKTLEAFSENRDDITAPQPETLPTPQPSPSIPKPEPKPSFPSARDRLDRERLTLTEQHQTERTAMSARHGRWDAGINRARAEGRYTGVVAWLMRVTGIQGFIDRKHQQQDLDRQKDQERQKAALQRRHTRELREFQRHYKALDRLERRERKSLETRERREALTPVRQKAPTPELKGLFSPAAQPPPEPEQKGTITPHFNDQANPTEEKTHDVATGGAGRLLEIKETAQQITKPIDPEKQALFDALKIEAEKKKRAKEKDLEKKPRDPGRDPGR